MIPLWWGLIGFIVALVIHEFGHGLLARGHGMRIRSFGLLQLGPLPLGAFAEPEGEELFKAPRRERQRMFAAGPLRICLLPLFCCCCSEELRVSSHPTTNPFTSQALSKAKERMKQVCYLGIRLKRFKARTLLDSMDSATLWNNTTQAILCL